MKVLFYPLPGPGGPRLRLGVSRLRADQSAQQRPVSPSLTCKRTRSPRVTESRRPGSSSVNTPRTATSRFTSPSAVAVKCIKILPGFEHIPADFPDYV